jgi:hypothetical protein
VILPVLAALAGALVFGVTGVLQQRAARRVKGETIDQAKLVRGLIRQRGWVLSTVGSLGGFALHALALGTGPIVLVQPLLVTGVLFAAITGFIVRRWRVDWPFMGRLLLTAAGLAAFLAVARPEPSSGEPTLARGLPLTRILPLGIVLIVLIVGCVLLSMRVHGLARSLALALASGIAYGGTAAVTKVTISVFSEGPIAVLTHWSLWALVVLGPLGFLLNQNAFREGALASPALAVITVVDPLVAVGIGILWLHEPLAATPGAIVGEVLALAAMALGVWLVANRAPHVGAGEQDEAASQSMRPPRRDGRSSPTR